jgi:hypothetical protein
MTAQLFQFIHRRRARCLSLDPHQHTRIALRINLAAALRVRTRISRLQGLVRNLDLLRPAIRGGTVAPMPRRGRTSSCMFLPRFAFLMPVSMPACFSTAPVFSVLAGHNNSRSDARVVSLYPSASASSSRSGIVPHRCRGYLPTYALSSSILLVDPTGGRMTLAVMPGGFHAGLLKLTLRASLSPCVNNRSASTRFA